MLLKKFLIAYNQNSIIQDEFYSPKLVVALKGWFIETCPRCTLRTSKDYPHIFGVSMIDKAILHKLLF